MKFSSAHLGNRQFSDYLLFADDLKLFKRIQSVNDAELLQKDLDHLYQWCIENRLYLNISKCSIMSYTHRSQPFSYLYMINNNNLLRSVTVRDLGVTFNTTLDYSQHIDNIVSNAYKVLGFLKRKTINFSNQNALKLLYFSLVRSNLEYCSLIWDPYYNNRIKTIEQVQTKFTHYLFYKSFHVSSQDLSSSHLRNIFGIPCLKSRRELSCVLFFYKVCNNLIDCNEILGSLHFSVPNRILRKHHLFRNPFTRLNYIDNFCVYKFYKIFNGIGEDLDIFNMSFNIFKTNCALLLHC